MSKDVHFGEAAKNPVELALEGEPLVIRRDEPKRAKLIEKNGRKVLVAPPGAPPMTPELVKTLLEDFP